MSFKPKEAIACLQVLACIAKADGQLQPEEQEALTEAYQKLQPLPPEVTIETLLDQTIPIEKALANITHPTLKIRLYEAAFAIAHIGGTTPTEQKLLDTIRCRFDLKSDKLPQLQVSIEPLKIPVEYNLNKVISPSQELAQEVRQLILDYAIGVAIFGFNPVPGLNTITTLGAYVLIFKMMRSIGEKWGYPKGQDTLAIIGNIFGGLGAFIAGLSSWVVISLAGFFVPIVGNFAAASYFFTITWALGQATNQFYASGRTMDASILKKAFNEAKKEGKKAYEANQSTIAEQQKLTETSLQALNQDFKTGKISQQEYQYKLENLI